MVIYTHMLLFIAPPSLPPSSIDCEHLVGFLAERIHTRPGKAFTGGSHITPPNL
jgi:hypothetical protein